MTKDRQDAFPFHDPAWPAGDPEGVAALDLIERMRRMAGETPPERAQEVRRSWFLGEFHRLRRKIIAQRRWAQRGAA